jgi:hypothetical protein
MRGHITKRSKVSWTIIVPLGRDPQTGKRRQKWVSVRGTKRDAERKLAELQHQINIGSFVEPTKQTVGEHLRKWLEGLNVRPRTLEGYRDRARHVVTDLGDVPLSELRPDHLQDYYVSKRASLSAWDLGQAPQLDS